MEEKIIWLKTIMMNLQMIKNLKEANVVVN